MYVFQIQVYPVHSIDFIRDNPFNRGNINNGVNPKAYMIRDMNPSLPLTEKPELRQVFPETWMWESLVNDKDQDEKKDEEDAIDENQDKDEEGKG